MERFQYALTATSQQAPPPPPPSAGLLTTIESAFLSGEYSDLVIQCHGRVFQAHKLVVCGQCEWFAKAVKKDQFQVSYMREIKCHLLLRQTMLQEGQTGVIDLPFDEPAVVNALLQYLYMFDYAVPDDFQEIIPKRRAPSFQQKAPDLAHVDTDEALPGSTIDERETNASFDGDRDLTGSRIDPSTDIGDHRPGVHPEYLWRLYHHSLTRPTHEGASDPALGEPSSSRREDPQPEYDERALPFMLFHINVYALADRVQHNPLKVLAQNRFQVLASKEWKSPDFPSTIEAVYSVAPPGSAGDSLRKIIVRLVVSHAKELFNLDRGFTAVLQDTPDFAVDLARALSGAGISTQGAEINLDVEELCCPNCKFVMRASLPSNITMLNCPLCKWDGIVNRWRNGMKDQGVLKKGRRSVLTSSWEL